MHNSCKHIHSYLKKIVCLFLCFGSTKGDLSSLHLNVYLPSVVSSSGSVVQGVVDGGSVVVVIVVDVDAARQKRKSLLSNHKGFDDTVGK